MISMSMGSFLEDKFIGCRHASCIGKMGTEETKVLSGWKNLRWLC